MCYKLSAQIHRFGRAFIKKVLCIKIVITNNNAHAIYLNYFDHYHKIIYYVNWSLNIVSIHYIYLVMNFSNLHRII